MARYAPTAVPETLAGMRAWLADQFRAIAASLQAPQAPAIVLEPRAVAPARPTDGMIVYADGSEWNPGDGAGPYVYEGGSWRKL